MLLLAEASLTEDYHLDQSEGKRYSVDPGNSAFGSISSSYSPKSYGFRSSQQFSNGPASISMCRQPSTSPNRTGEKSWKKSPGNAVIRNPMRHRDRSVFLLFLLVYSAPSESQESKAPANKDPTTWSVDDVVWFIRDADPQALGPHADIFRKHVGFGSDQPLGSKWLCRTKRLFLHLLGDWWKRSSAPEERHDHEVPGTQAGASPEALLPHWQTKAD